VSDETATQGTPEPEAIIVTIGETSYDIRPTLMALQAARDYTAAVDVQNACKNQADEVLWSPLTKSLNKAIELFNSMLFSHGEVVKSDVDETVAAG